MHISMEVIHSKGMATQNHPKVFTKEPQHAEVKEVYDVIVTQTKHHFEGESHSLPVTVIEVQVFIPDDKERFPS